ncbi:MAG: FtsQ-type POTRA domain-containing protein [Clostridia bacterium]|nr:FtsQ-type POTRA domain-containing protein [Clostridia bacterium]
MQKNSRDKQRTKKNKNPKIEKEKRMRKYRIIKSIFKLVIFIALLTGLVVYAFTSPIFNINEIRVLGNEEFSEEEYLKLSELKTGENIFNFRKSTIISNIKTNGYVESVKIKRKLPTKIDIIIEERTPTYLICLEEGQFAYINNQGYILEKSEIKLPLSIITGISTNMENVIEGNRLENEDLEKLQNVIQIIDAMKNIEIEEELSKIDITNKNNYILTFEQEAKEVYLGDVSNLSSKILYMKCVLEEQEGIPGIIYLNQEQVYFSPK